MRKEIYDFERRIARYRRIIAGLRNGDVVLKMLDHLTSLGLSQAAISNHAAHLVAVLRLIDFDVKEVTRGDVERVVAKINGNKSWSEQTKYHKRAVLRRLVQYAKVGSCERGAPLPPEVSWIKLSKKKNDDSRVTPERLLTQSDFESLVRAADNRRDKAMLYVLFEGALRPGELLSMEIASVKFKEVGDGYGWKCRYCVVSVNGKTGLKVVPLVASAGPLLEWLNEYPRRSEPHAPLWCSLATNYKGERLSYRHFRLIIKRLAKKAGLEKDVWPYLFRHSKLTALAKVFTEAKLEKFARWVHGSKMSARYVHFSGRDLEDAMLELHGIKGIEKDVEILRLIECPMCRHKNPVGETRCKSCGYILDKRLAAEMEAEEKRKDELIIQRIENLERMIMAIIDGDLKRAASTLQVREVSDKAQPS